MACMIDGLHESGRTNFLVPLGAEGGVGDTLWGPAEDVEAIDLTSSLHDSPDNTEPGDTGKLCGPVSEVEVLDLASICKKNLLVPA